MSITYEEALETLNSMFGERWDNERLDTILRHFEGHMENTIESILGHGDKNPDELLEKLANGTTNDDLVAGGSIDRDAEIARQLAAEEQRQESRRAPPATRRIAQAPASSKKALGTPTQLPPDFLRIPGHESYTSGSATIDSDEQLARMLQNELLQKELKNNKEFAHLANARSGRNEAASGNLTNNGPDLIDKIGELGEQAKMRLGMFAQQVNQQVQQFNQNRQQGKPLFPPVGSHNQASPAQERRGLLDDDDPQEEVSFLSSSGSNYEMKSMGAAGGKKQD